MIRFSLFILLLTITTICSAQKGVNKKDMVGFGCTKAEVQSKAVSKAMNLYSSSDYQGLINMLDSKSQAEKFLAVVLLEKLESDSSIALKKDQKQKIELIYDSKRKVSFCSGCMYWDKMTLNEALKMGSKPRRLAAMSIEWIEI